MWHHVDGVGRGGSGKGRDSRGGTALLGKYFFQGILVLPLKRQELRA